MNIKAKRITFWDTWVIESIVVTHFRKPVVGIASETSGAAGLGVTAASSTKWRVKEDSNQKKQVICHALGMRCGRINGTGSVLT